MNILLLLVPLSLVLLLAAIGAFVWAVRRDQFEDLDAPAISILFDDDGDRPRPARTGAPAAAASSGAAAAARTPARSGGSRPAADGEPSRRDRDDPPSPGRGQRDAH